MPFDLAVSFIEALEREIGGKLPASYVAAMQVSNVADSFSDLAAS